MSSTTDTDADGELWQRKLKLRRAHRLSLNRDGEELLVLQDPIQLAEPFALEPEFAELLDLLDGERTLKQVRETLLMRSMWSIDRDSLLAFARELESESWLEGETFNNRWALEVTRFERNRTRAMMAAGQLYPASAQQVGAVLDGPKPETSRSDRTTPRSTVRGIVTPYQPLSSCPELYSNCLRELPEADDIDLIVLIGVDLGPALTPFVLTEKNYETPLGSLQTDTDLVHEMATAMPWLVREGLRHRVAPSLELAAVLAQHCYRGAAPKVLPILCGRTADIQGEWYESFMAAMEVVLTQRRCLLWCSAELSHIGPAFGHAIEDKQLNEAFARAESTDRYRLEALAEGQLRRFIERCDSETEDPARPSGGAALHCFCQLLPVGYQLSHTEYISLPAPGNKPGRSGIVGLRATA